MPRWLTAVAALLFVASANAAPVPFPTQTSQVRLDGVAIGQPLHPSSGNSLRFTIGFDAATGLYHLWVLNGGDTQTPADMQVADITHATSSDGRNFVSQGKLTPPASWWTAIPGVGATAEPSVNFLRVDRIGASWYLTIWSPNETGTGLYNYNANVWLIGPSPGNLNVVQRGPLPSLSEVPTGPGGNMVGSFGMANGNLYLRQDTQFDSGPPLSPPYWGGGMGRYAYTDTTRPALSPVWGTSEADLFGTTPYCWVLPGGGPNQCTTFPTRTPSYVHNSGRVAMQGAALGAYYTFRDWNTGARLAKQIYYVESGNDGLAWSAPTGVYANGDAVLVEGLPNAANFSSPEIAALPGSFRPYFSTANACGQSIVVTAEDPAQPRGPTIVKAFATGLLPPGGTTTLTVTLAAPAATCTPAPVGTVFTQVGFTDTLPSGLVLATPPNATNTCGGALTAVAGAATFGLVNASLTAGQSCVVTVAVTAIGLGAQSNVIARTGGSPGTPGYFNAQGAAALQDAGATLIVAAAAPTDVPALSPAGLAALAALLGLLAFAVMRRRAG
jgi:hypothetical protein